MKFCGQSIITPFKDQFGILPISVTKGVKRIGALITSLSILAIWYKPFRHPNDIIILSHGWLLLLSFNTSSVASSFSSPSCSSSSTSSSSFKFLLNPNFPTYLHPLAPLTASLSSLSSSLLFLLLLIHYISLAQLKAQLLSDLSPVPLPPISVSSTTILHLSLASQLLFSNIVGSSAVI